MRLAADRLEHDDDLGIKSFDVVAVEIFLRIERQSIDTLLQRLAGGIQGALPPVVVGVTAADVIPSAIFGLPLQRHADAGGRAALRSIENVRGDRAHRSWPNRGPMHSPCSNTISPPSIVAMTTPRRRAPSYGVSAWR